VADAPPRIALEGVGKSFDGGRTWAVRGVDLAVARGELVVLLGTSGCGKTTTLKTINRLVEPSAGRVLVDGRDVAGLDPVALRRGIGYVFQEIGLFPHVSVAENVAIVPRLFGWERARIRERTRELFALVGLDLDVHGERRPSELSGGQAQRVGVARALAAEPDVLLMDEPFGALDPLTRDDLQREFAELRRRLGLTVVLVTHDVSEALLLADRIAVMHAGRVVACGDPAALLADAGHDHARRILATPRRQAKRVQELLAAAERRAPDGGAP
jgi:osmoprotectant transport system ATP-binding protein